LQLGKRRAATEGACRGVSSRPDCVQQQTDGARDARVTSVHRSRLIQRGISVESAVRHRKDRHAPAQASLQRAVDARGALRYTPDVTVAENHLIALLPRWDRAELTRECELVRLAPSMVLGMPGETTRHAYFPLDCAIALVTVNGSAPGLEVGLVGREGMLGVQLVLGVSAVPLHALVQGAGTARRIAAGRFRRLLSASGALQRTLHGYVHVLMVQLASSAACTLAFTASSRGWCGGCS